MLKSAISRAEAAVVSSGNSYASATLASKYSLAGQVVKVRVGGLGLGWELGLGSLPSSAWQVEGALGFTHMKWADSHLSGPLFTLRCDLRGPLLTHKCDVSGPLLTLNWHSPGAAGRGGARRPCAAADDERRCAAYATTHCPNT